MRASCLLLLLAACAAPSKNAPTPSPEPPPVQAEDPRLDDAQWRAEARLVVFERHIDLAGRYRDAGDLDEALGHVDQALLLEPTSDRARRLRTELQRAMGQRSGEVSTMMEDEWLAMQAREEERVIAAQHALDEARRAEEAGDFELAANLYKRAAYLAREK